MTTFNKETSRLSYSSLTRLIKEGKDSFLNPVYKKSNAAFNKASGLSYLILL